MADAHGSGPCDSNIVRVQVPFPAVNCIYTVRGSAGIGRQARLRILCLYRRVGSSPIFRIENKKTQTSNRLGLFCFHG